MDKQELVIEKYICITTPNPLSKEARKMWFEIVKDYGPDGNILPVQVYHEGGRKSYSMLSKKTKEGYLVCVSLNRDLTPNEVEKITEAWEAFFEGDFEIEASSIDETIQEDDEVDELNREVLQEDLDHAEFAEELSKLHHTRWLTKMQNDGWRYGMKFSKEEKTNPMLLPWEQLPEEYAEIDYDYAEEVIALLERLGYEICEK